jgi:hypothetical protein
VRRGIVADKNCGETDVAELGDRRRDLGAYLRGERLAIDDRCRHEARL